MRIVSDYDQNRSYELSAPQAVIMLKKVLVDHENEIESIKDKIKKYEQKRRSQEVWYQSLSPVRKFFAGRPPSHHQAVEHLVQVKERFRQIDTINQKISEVTRLIQSIESEPENEKWIIGHDLFQKMTGYLEGGA